MSAPSGALHWQRDGDRTICGRLIRGMLRLAADPKQVTCTRCHQILRNMRGIQS